MTALRKLDLISEEEYLNGELASDTRHEYLNGKVYAMAGAKNSHEMLCANILVLLGVALKGKPCRPFGSNTKIRYRKKQDRRFYYPDALVVCEPNSLDETFQDKPVVIFEVLSDSTRRTDEEEKKEAYTKIDSLQAYLLVEQDQKLVRILSRNDSGDFEEAALDEGSIPLEAINIQIEVDDIYEGLSFS